MRDFIFFCQKRNRNGDNTALFGSHYVFVYDIRLRAYNTLVRNFKNVIGIGVYVGNGKFAVFLRNYPVRNGYAAERHIGYSVGHGAFNRYVGHTIIVICVKNVVFTPYNVIVRTIKMMNAPTVKPFALGHHSVCRRSVARTERYADRIVFCYAYLRIRYYKFHAEPRNRIAVFMNGCLIIENSAPCAPHSGSVCSAAETVIAERRNHKIIIVRHRHFGSVDRRA